jgi:signal transduction histidine kinase
MALYFDAKLCLAVTALFRRLLLPLLLVARLATAAEPVIDTIAKVRALSPEQAARSLPVRLEATVIYFDPSPRCLFIKDNTACSYVAFRYPDRYSCMDLEPGSRIRIEGTTDPRDFFPIIMDKQIELIGKGALPEPRKVREDELLSPALDSEWVEFPAVVTGVESGGDAFTLVIEVHGWVFKVLLPLNEHSSERAAGLMQHTVRIQAVVGTLINYRRQMTARYFFSPSFDQIIPLDEVAPSVTPPLRSIAGLLLNLDTAQTLVRIEGVVTQDDGSDFYLRDATGSTLVRTARKNSFRPGDQVVAEGFAAMAPFRPVFRARKVAMTGRTEVPPPRPLDFDWEKLPNFHEELVALDAFFIARRDRPAEKVLQCRVGDRFFEAVQPLDSALPEGLAPGDLLRLTGICELTTTRPIPRREWVDGFRIHLPEVGGIVILQHPSWWTLKHLLILLGIISFVAVMALAWVWVLRLRVKAQTATIGEKLQQVGAHEERQRIARDLHDTVEQELTGLSMELGCISAKIAGEMKGSDPGRVPEILGESHQMLDYAQKMLCHCREEARVSIHNLRCIELEQRGLPGAFKELLPSVAGNSGAKFELQVTGEPRSLDETLENHLLRIAQEGVTNAARHAAPDAIAVRLDYQPDGVTLEIQDTGRGFDPGVPTPKGHYGLHGLRERARKIGAALSIDSAPGEGTTVRVVVPINAKL